MVAGPARRLHRRPRGGVPAPTTSSATSGGPDSARCGCGSTTPSAPGRRSLAAGCDGPGARSRTTPSASSTATCSCARRRRHTAVASSTERSQLATSCARARAAASVDRPRGGGPQTKGPRAHRPRPGRRRDGPPRRGDALRRRGAARPFATGKVYCSLIAAARTSATSTGRRSGPRRPCDGREQHPFAIFPGICRLHRAIVLKRRGALEAAEEEATQACEELRQSHVANSATAWAEVGDIRRRLGRARSSGGGLRPIEGDQRRAVRRARTAAPGAGSCRRGHGDHHQLCGRRGRNPLGRGAVLPILVHVAVAVGDLDAARARAGRARGHVASLRHGDTARHRALDTRADSQLAEADPAADRRRCARQSTLGTALDVPYEEATARTLLGQALRVAGDERRRDRSRSRPPSGCSTRSAPGSRPQQVLADSKPALPAGLTAGRSRSCDSSPQGSPTTRSPAELFLSAKTVSRHLSNIFTKIGVSSRRARQRSHSSTTSTPRGADRRKLAEPLPRISPSVVGRSATMRSSQVRSSRCSSSVSRCGMQALLVSPIQRPAALVADARAIPSTAPHQSWLPVRTAPEPVRHRRPREVRGHDCTSRSLISRSHLRLAVALRSSALAAGSSIRDVSLLVPNPEDPCPTAAMHQAGSFPSRMTTPTSVC